MVEHANIIVLAALTHRFRFFADKILIDAMNRWEPIGDDDGGLAPAPEGSRVVVQMYLPSTRVVMSFNQLNCHGFEEDRRAATPRAEWPL